MLCADGKLMKKPDKVGVDKISWVFLQFFLSKPTNHFTERFLGGE